MSLAHGENMLITFLGQVSGSKQLCLCVFYFIFFKLHSPLQLLFRADCSCFFQIQTGGLVKILMFSERRLTHITKSEWVSLNKPNCFPVFSQYALLTGFWLLIRM